jgi:hypothetical protein
MPGARPRAIVPKTHAAVTISPSAARNTPMVHRSCPTPGVFVAFDSGT